MVLARDVVFWTGEVALVSGGTLKWFFQQSTLGASSIVLGVLCFGAWRWMTTTQRQAELRHDLELLKELVVSLATGFVATGFVPAVAVHHVASSHRESAAPATRPSAE